jgi:hypothetical protein
VQKLAYSLTLLIGGVIILLFNMGVKPMKTMVIVAAFYATLPVSPAKLSSARTVGSSFVKP